MKKQTLISAALCAGLTAPLFAGLANAADNPFAAKQLSAGYQLAQADKKADGKCGEAKCGADKKAMEKKADGHCGDKKADAKCGADKKPSEKKKDGKCGEAKCGANK
ncbi:MAG: hypothetical protein LWW81_00625 [Rhodocyclales bacterium]|nr:hypothetical protein [Rhodocyclales bacterium]